MHLRTKGGGGGQDVSSEGCHGRLTPNVAGHANRGFSAPILVLVMTEDRRRAVDWPHQGIVSDESMGIFATLDQPKAP